MLIVVGVSTFFNIIKNGIVVPMYCSKLLNIEFTYFGKVILKSIISTAIITLIVYAISLLVIVDSWMKLILAVLAVAILGLSLNYVFILSKDEKKAFFKMISKKLRRS